MKIEQIYTGCLAQGAYYIESDGEVISQPISVNYTGDWGDWDTKIVSNIPLKSGKSVLRLFFENGELNLGSMTFTYESPLLYDQPIANAGENIMVVLPETITTLDGSNSIDPEGANLLYSWTQVYGPSTLVFSSNNVSQPTISSLEEGIYLLRLTVDNGSYSDMDEVYVISSTSTNVAPTVSIYAPTENAVYIEYDPVMISASASDLVGYVEKVEFLVNNELIGTVTQTPYNIEWTNGAGEYSLVAIAYDNDGSSTTSQAINISLTPAPSCEGSSYNGEFDYLFSPDDNDPTLTFIPSQTGVGNPTCILYYGTNSNSLPGYHVTPNVPYQLSANEGEKIYFYYTYSYPGQGDHNKSEHKNTYEIGSCKPSSISNYNEEIKVKYYPNPVTNKLNLELPRGENEIVVYNITGKIISQTKVVGRYFSYDMSNFGSGLFVFKVLNNGKQKMFKVIK